MADHIGWEWRTFHFIKKSLKIEENNAQHDRISCQWLTWGYGYKEMALCNLVLLQGVSYAFHNHNVSIKYAVPVKFSIDRGPGGRYLLICEAS